MAPDRTLRTSRLTGANRPACSLALPCLCLMAGLWAAWSAGAQIEPRKLRVLTSFLPVYCFAANVAGGLAEVQNLLPPGVEPHDFQFSPREMKLLAGADLIVINGLQLESWLAPVLAGQAGPKTVVEAAAGLPDSGTIHWRNYFDPGERPVTASNPHIWLDPRLAAHAVTNILAAFQKADPAHANDYQRNALAYLARLEKLDADLRAGLAPFKDRPVVTLHDAFPYFARRYHLRIVGVIEEVPEVQPSPRHLARLHQVIEREHVRVIFSERQSASKLAEMLGRDYHLAVAPLDTIESGPFEPAAYENAMRTNLAVLEKSFP